MKFEVIATHSCRKPRFLKTRNVFYKTEPYEVPFLLYVNKVVKLLWKNQKN